MLDVSPAFSTHHFTCCLLQDRFIKERFSAILRTIKLQLIFKPELDRSQESSPLTNIQIEETSNLPIYAASMAPHRELSKQRRGIHDRGLLFLFELLPQGKEFQNKPNSVPTLNFPRHFKSGCKLISLLGLHMRISKYVTETRDLHGEKYRAWFGTVRTLICKTERVIFELRRVCKDPVHRTINTQQYEMSVGLN